MDRWEILLTAAIAAFCFALGSVFETESITNDCNALGKFHITGTVYECRKEQK